MLEGLSVQAGHAAANSRSSRAPGGRKPAGSADNSAASSPPGPLQASVLVLNRLYMAVHVIGVRRAFCLLCRELAEVIHYEQGVFANYTFETWREASRLRARSKQSDEDWIRAVNFEIQVPRVIRLLNYDRLPKQHLHLNRRNVLARDGHLCQYCGRHFPVQQLSLDHVVPRSRGRTNHVGERRLRLPGLQRSQGRPHAARSQDEPGPPPRKAATQSAPAPETEEPQVRELADLARRRALGNRRTGLEKRC